MKTLLEKVISQLKDTKLNDHEREIAEEILWNTNERGYLDIFDLGSFIWGIFVHDR